MNITSHITQGLPEQQMKELVETILHGLQVNGVFNLDIEADALNNTWDVKTLVQELCWTFGLPMKYIVNKQVTVKSSNVVTQNFYGAAELLSYNLIDKIQHGLLLSAPTLIQKAKERTTEHTALVGIAFSLDDVKGASGTIDFKTLPIRGKEFIVGKIKVEHEHLMYPVEDLIISLFDGVYVQRSDLANMQRLRLVLNDLFKETNSIFDEA